MGNATQASYSIQLDGVSYALDGPGEPDTLVKISGLNNGNHTLSLTAHITGEQTSPPRSMLVFDKATLDAPSPSNSTDECVISDFGGIDSSIFVDRFLCSR